LSLEIDISNIRVVLVNTSHPGNIGASARAMKNMGLKNLTLVQPGEFPSGVAVGRAVSAIDILDRAVVVDSLQEAVKDCGLVIGASARSRKIPWPVIRPEECAEKAVTECRNSQVAIVFGREDSGLTNDELQLCHFHVQIPTDEKYSSLNLAAAVMVITYELHRAALKLSGDQPQVEEDYWDIEKATGEQVEHLHEHLERVLIRLDFHDVDNPRQLMQRMRRLFGRIRLDLMEMNILRGFLARIELYLENPKPGQKVRQKLQNKIESQTGEERRPSPKKEIRKRKDFADTALNKRQVNTMAEILEQASKNKRKISD